MKKIKLALGLLSVLTLVAFIVVESVSWKLKEDGYSVNFKGGKVSGILKGMKSTILFDEANPEKSKFSVSLDVTTINTGNGMMNKHAQGTDALDAKQFPQITFESTSVTKKGSAYEATGKLTMKGITKEIIVPFTFENKGTEAIFKGKFSVLPKEFNITKSGTPDNLEIELTIPVTK
ncbi:MAG TPA: YceI family protein [Cytophagaceae bacterium]|jgi:polyisoprenoid-binding protein YceI|nr:YceI family protein [Cytophagaceae bacterium]